MLNRNIHRTILLQILKEIYTEPSLGPVLGFKGGTAAHFFYDLGRFSVDLDFDLLNEREEDNVFQKTEKILREFGTIKEKYKKRYTQIFIISYDDTSPNIKVEINKRRFGSRYELKHYLGISMLVMVRDDMFAHKIVALLERTKVANRDIYDVWFFLRHNWPINKEIIEMRTGTSFKQYWGKCVKFAEALKDRKILDGMGELLEEKQKTWAKINLKNDLLFLLKVRLEQEK